MNMAYLGNDRIKAQCYNGSLTDTGAFDAPLLSAGRSSLSHTHTELARLAFCVAAPSTSNSTAAGGGVNQDHKSLPVTFYGLKIAENRSTLGSLQRSPRPHSCIGGGEENEKGWDWREGERMGEKKNGGKGGEGMSPPLLGSCLRPCFELP